MITIQFNEQVIEWLTNAIGCTDETAIAEGQEFFSLMVASGALTDDTDALRARLTAAERLREVAQFFASLVDTMDRFALLEELDDCGGDSDGIRFMQEQARAALAEWQALNKQAKGGDPA
jgi:hypothetical protein